MSNNYHFFGCSWTGLTSVNYVQELAKLEPDHNFYNWAVQGSSISMSTFLLEQVKRKFKTPNNYFIFQVTNTGRVTWWDDEYKQWWDNKYDRAIKPEKRTNNYYRTKHRDINNEIVGGFSAAGCPIVLARKYQKQYYRWTSSSTMNHDHRMHCHYAKNNSNFMFFHRAHASKHEEFKDHLVVENVLGRERYQELCDQLEGKTSKKDTHHFGLEGAQWQAKWIRKVASECCRWDK
ncbi:MAG: hypothetical protein CMA64_06060 [Euryarchaeota archaeon]|nr:hypothetical protein [Euryarchaeota archaeon]